MNTTIIMVFVCYLMVMIGIGAYFYRKNKNIDDYVLGGRSLNPWVASMSAAASDMSGWLVMALPGLAFLSAVGVKSAVWTAIGLALGTYVNWLFVAKRLRAYSEVAGDSITIPQFLSNRFQDKSGALRIICAGFILLFFLIYVSSMFVAKAKLFSTIFEMEYMTALIVGGIIIVLYTFMGGFLAVAWGDTLNGVLMFATLLAVPLILLFGGHIDTNTGMSAIVTGFTSLGPSEGVGIIAILSGIAWGLGYFGQPHILPRFMAIRSVNDVQQARIIGTTWVVVSLAGAVAVGILGQQYFTGGLDNHETVLIVLAQQLFPPIIAGLFLAAVFGAIMSTADSQLIVAASAFSNDIYGVVKKDIEPKKLLLISRVSLVVIALCAMMVATNPDNTVLSLVSFAWGGFGAAFGPTLLFSLFWRKMTLQACYAGVITGGIGSVVFYMLKIRANGVGFFAIYEILPAFIIASIVIVIVSKITAQPNQDVVDKFDEAVKAAMTTKEALAKNQKT